MSEDMSEEEIVWKLRSQIFEGEPKAILIRARELLGMRGHQAVRPTVSEPLKQDLYRICAQIAKLAENISARAAEEEKELRWIAEQVSRLSAQISAPETERKRTEESAVESEEERKKRIWWKEKDERDLV
jgi:hypothetical protein